MIRAAHCSPKKKNNLRGFGATQPARASRAPHAGPQHGAGGPQAHSPPCLQKLEEQDRRALSIKEQLQRQHRFLKRRLEQLSVQSLERVRTDSTGSAVSTDDSEQEVDVEGMEFGPGELDSVGSSSDVDDHYSLQSDGGYGPPCRRPARPGLS
ncbi:max dimerization protein 4 [Myotis lucifugus]|nr:max dimerization protein 4 [Myotis lucifugus]